MHRYRDAILHTEPTNSTYRAAIKNLGGIILYPYPLREADFITNGFYKSIEQVNIGALPFLPSKCGLVSELLNTMINKTPPEEHFERFIEMDNSEYIKRRNLWKEWVTIGTIQKQNQHERLKFLEENSLFHIPLVKNLHSKIYLTKKLLVCIAGTSNAKLYDVIKWEILSDKELIEKGVNWNMRSNKYVVFNLRNSIEIKIPDNLSPLNFRYATQEGLNRYLNDPVGAENYFYLTNSDAARLHEELKSRNIDFSVKWAGDNTDPSLVKFQIYNWIVFSSENFPELIFKIDDQLIHFSQLQKII